MPEIMLVKAKEIKPITHATVNSAPKTTMKIKPAKVETMEVVAILKAPSLLTRTQAENTKKNSLPVRLRFKEKTYLTALSLVLTAFIKERLRTRKLAIYALLIRMCLLLRPSASFRSKAETRSFLIRLKPGR